jgi:ATP-dependent RNA helicase HelY
LLERIGVPASAPFVPDPFQTEALQVLQEADVLVTAPTGAGKTYIAIQAIERVTSKGGRCWYASPLKALSNAKYEEFAEIFGREQVGILTGDRKENTHAPIIVGTTEILRNQLYDAMHLGENLTIDLVVLDEAHYLGDEDRGVVWEEVLIYLPHRIRILLLSATIRNAQQICDWLTWLRHSPCRWVAAHERPVPLFPLFLFPAGELAPLATRKGMYSKIQSVERKSFSRRDFPDIARLLEVLGQTNLLPAIFFLKSRADCEKAVTLCPPLPTAHARRKDHKAFQSRLQGLLATYPFLRRHQHLGFLEKARVGAHHGGQLPHWKLLLEKLMQEGKLQAIFSTSTVAAGVNFPARTVVILQSDRFNGRDFVDLTATDLLQMTGRAGRRGMDEIGFVLVAPGPYQDPQLIHDLLNSQPDPIRSQIRINFSMVLNLLLSHQPEEIRMIFASCLATYQNLSQESSITRELDAVQQELSQWLPEMACGSLDLLATVRPQYALLKEKLRKAQKSLKQRAAQMSVERLLAPGRLFFSQRGTPYVAVRELESDFGVVEAVRLHPPIRFREGRVRTRRVRLHRIREFGILLKTLPGPTDRKSWYSLVARISQETTTALIGAAADKIQEPAPPDLGLQQLSVLTWQKADLPCNVCALFGACQKSERHPLARLLERYFHYLNEMRTVQDQLWRSFLHHYHVLQEEGYADQAGHLTRDGQWASKLRLDQPLLISEGIRRRAFPDDHPALLAALVATFVMDRDRPGEVADRSLAYRHPELAGAFFKLLDALRPLRERLEASGFGVPPLPFWPTVVAYHWAQGEDWDTLRTIAGMDEGDLAMVILRTADHLRQMESLSGTHPRLADSARKGIELLLREPVLIA